MLRKFTDGQKRRLDAVRNPDNSYYVNSEIAAKPSLPLSNQYRGHRPNPSTISTGSGEITTLTSEEGFVRANIRR